MAGQLTKAQMRSLRVVINRALQGPDWFADAASPEAYELRARTRTWLRLIVVRDLQELLPLDERVKLDGVKQ